MGRKGHIMRMNEIPRHHWAAGSYNDSKDLLGSVFLDIVGHLISAWMDSRINTPFTGSTTVVLSFVVA